jgi:hypothetical protein
MYCDKALLIIITTLSHWAWAVTIVRTFFGITVFDWCDMKKFLMK